MAERSIRRTITNSVVQALKVTINENGDALTEKLAPVEFNEHLTLAKARTKLEKLYPDATIVVTAVDLVEIVYDMSQADFIKYGVKREHDEDGKIIPIAE